MITPNLATIVLAIASLLLLILIPILDGTPKFSKYISLRYTLTTMVLILALGCVLDFSHLMESSRNIVLIGAMVLVGIFVIARSFEKLKLGNKVIDVTLKKGDIEASAKIENKLPETPEETEKSSDDTTDKKEAE